MPGETIQVEELENGLRAAFINMPHFRTHSARLMVNAGSLHETPDAHGAAHFLEHVTFQGTEAMPDAQDVHDFAEEKGLTQNAFTGKTTTLYVADGYELESVGHFVSQLAFRPLLLSDALESERKPIADELRRSLANPSHYADIAHAKATRGEVFARTILGTEKDIEQMSAEALRTYHQRHYRLGNAVLVICLSLIHI